MKHHLGRHFYWKISLFNVPYGEHRFGLALKVSAAVQGQPVRLMELSIGCFLGYSRQQLGYGFRNSFDWDGTSQKIFEGVFKDRFQ